MKSFFNAIYFSFFFLIVNITPSFGLENGTDHIGEREVKLFTADGVISSTWGVIVPQVEFGDIQQLADRQGVTWVDLDDVVITPRQWVCSSGWFRNYRRDNANRIPVISMLDDFYHCQSNTKLMPVDARAIATLSALSFTRVILGLTARDWSNSNETQLVLDKLGMTFTNITNEQELTRYGERIAHRGVFYVGHDEHGHPRDKGRFVGELFDVGFFPSNITVRLIDDSLAHHKEMAAACEERDIKFQGLHLTSVAQYLAAKRFTPEELQAIGKIQHEAVRKGERIPTDDEALMIYWGEK